MQFNRVRLEVEREELEIRTGSADVKRKLAMLIREGDLVLEDRRELEPHEEVEVLAGYEEPEEGVPTERLKVLRVKRVEFVG
ncbi:MULTISPECIES: hypothetical protein [unclassified Methanopyrus]|uniref:hypothetical protein n=1 Tax=Methanopyrus sp. SNP6 TaxID=1937005 RepID=UPI0011E5B88D|nr:hypothetical protein [Methanopyrus sp. SNP6]